LALRYFLRLDGISWEKAFGISKDGPLKNALSGIGVIGLTLPTVLFLLSLSQVILISFGLEPGLQDSVFRMLESKDFGEIARVVFLALVAAPLVEEFFFRGIIYRRLRVHIEPLGANVIQAALFSCVHFYLAGFLPLFLLGFVLARLFEKNGSLTACVVGHMSFNLFNIGVILLMKWQNVS
jgi:membrane protease YdiL (CAAX protease family)